MDTLCGCRWLGCDGARFVTDPQSTPPFRPFSIRPSAEPTWPRAVSGRPRACILIGGEALLIECGDVLLGRDWHIAAIVSDRAAVQRWAADKDLPVFDTPEQLLQARTEVVDYLFSITNLKILPAPVLALARVAINFHDGPLPAYAGLNTPTWALFNDEQMHGVTWHLMTEGVDRGSVVASQAVAIDRRDTSATLNGKCFAAGVDSFNTLLDTLSQRVQLAVPQPAGERRYYGKSARIPAAGWIRWEHSADQIAAHVRALNFGAHFNPLGSARAVMDDRTLIVLSVEPQTTISTCAPGTIVGIEPDRILVATSTVDIALVELADRSRAPLDVHTASKRLDLRPGRRFDILDDAAAAEIAALDVAIAPHEAFWRRRLATILDFDIPSADVGRPLSGAAPAAVDRSLAAGCAVGSISVLAAAAVGYFARLVDRDDIALGYANPVLLAQVESGHGLCSSQVPLVVPIAFDQPFNVLHAAVEADIRELHRRIGFATDLVARSPEMRGQIRSRDVMPLAVVQVDRLEDAQLLEGAVLTLALHASGTSCRWLYDSGRLAAEAVATMHEQFAVFLAAALSDPECSLAQLPILTPEERQRVLIDWNATSLPLPGDPTLHALFVAQVDRTPDAIALVCRDEAITYRDLDRRSNQLARYLIGSGIGPDVLVGLFVERSIALVTALLAIHKAGGAYVPLDPSYPVDRIAYMIEDARMPIVLCTGHTRDHLPGCAARVVDLDEVANHVESLSDASVGNRACSSDLAYVIYTSGSTGKPKGVMVEHRNVVNFCVGIDARIAAPGTLFAVTSLSFDISVLELCWTLTRGFKVVIQTGDATRTKVPEAGPPVDFSLFYFSGDAGDTSGDVYRLLLEGAKFADRNGFAAVWTPERHFHAFGGLYPNPAVTSAAIAAVTERVQIRAGSVVLPLHHPARVAEEWAVVDRLSGGRIGISFAAGWQPDDFILRPESFADAKHVMLRDIDVVRRLWRGEAVDFPGALGKPVSVSTLPRPVQTELPFWLTAAGNIETFAAAGRLGANLLTHLLGQTVAELAEKIAAYRGAWRDAGHAGGGRVSLMLHSFVGADAEQVRETVRAPLIAYLRSSASLIKQYAWSFPAFKRRPGMEQASDIDLAGLDEDELDVLLDHAFERYYVDAGLFGTPAECRAMVERVQLAGVDEIACLIDFGVAPDVVLEHLPWLDRVRRTAAASHEVEESVPDLIRRHGVTHLQCTPSLAQMMLDGGVDAASLATLQQIMIGGEAFPPSLAKSLGEVTNAQISNMYGPTETTIWSATDRVVSGEEDSLCLGRPLANQEIYLLDRRGEPVCPGSPGEIVIAGNGVTRGYLDRPDLTAERFVAHPLRDGERAYRTGDLGRLEANGRLAFLGRLDHQVKVRGHRIELGEIEASLARQAEVSQVIVVAREDVPGDVRLCAYIVGRAGEHVDGAALRDRLRAELPDFMVPSHIIALTEFAQTPNGKIDRRALPAPSEAMPVGETQKPDFASVEPSPGIEGRIAALWCDILKLPRVGITDNFFDCGGHSLLAVQLHRRLKAEIAPTLSIVDIFRFPTIASLCAHLADSTTAAAATNLVQSRALARLATRNRRSETLGRVLIDGEN